MQLQQDSCEKSHQRCGWRGLISDIDPGREPVETVQDSPDEFEIRRNETKIFEMSEMKTFS